MLIADIACLAHNSTSNPQWVDMANAGSLYPAGSGEDSNSGLYQGIGLGFTIAQRVGEAVVNGVQCANHRFNPVSLTLRHGPSVVATPLRFMIDEVNGLKGCLSNPSVSLSEVLSYFMKKPIRMARLLQALGVSIDPATMAILKSESDLEKTDRMAASILNDSINPAKVATTKLERVRGKIILSLVKAAIDGGEELMDDMCKLIPKLATLSGERVAAKALVKAGVL